MKYYRYGKFCFSDYSLSWVGIIILVIFAISSIMLDLALIFAVFPIIHAMIWLLAILLPNREKFILHNDCITIYFNQKAQDIMIPKELVLVVSHADICPPFSTRIAIGNQTHILKNKYAITILRKMPLDTALETLHRNLLCEYTTSFIQNVFDNSFYIYSFVYNQFLLEKLLSNRKCLLIIPRSLSNRITVNSNTTDIYIDNGC